MRRGAWSALALAALVPALAAADEGVSNKADAPKQAKKEGPPKPAAQLEEIQGSFQKVMVPSQQEYSEAKSAEARAKVLERALSLAGQHMARAVTLARHHPDDPAAVEALLWVISIQLPGKESPVQAEALAMLASDHAARPGVGLVLTALAGRDIPGAEKFLKAVLEKNPRRELQGQAALVLAQMLKERADAQTAKHDPAADATAREAEACYERVIHKYADVKQDGLSLKEQAEGDLFELRHLALGKTAPDIEGEDSSGKKFKLSDYRGKVVVLDFWARG